MTTLDDLLYSVCEEKRDAFANLLGNGIVSEEYVDHVENCPACRAAIKTAFEKSAKCFEELSRRLREKSGQPQEDNETGCATQPENRMG